MSAVAVAELTWPWHACSQEEPATSPQVHTGRFRVIPKGIIRKWLLILPCRQGKVSAKGFQRHSPPCPTSTWRMGPGQWWRITKGSVGKDQCQERHRKVPIHPNDLWLMGMLRYTLTWPSYLDCNLPPQFSQLSPTHYLDDFLVGAPASRECTADVLVMLLSAFDRLCPPVAMGKIRGHLVSAHFLGLQS